MPERRCCATSGCWPSRVASFHPGTLLSPRRVLAWPRPSSWRARPAPRGAASAAARIGLAKAFILAGEPAAAVAVSLLAVSECEQFRGPGHLDAINAREELADAYQAAGDVGDACRLLARCLKDRERLLGPRDVQTIAIRERLAATYLAEGRAK